MPKIVSLRNLPTMEDSGIMWSQNFASRKMGGISFLTSAYGISELYSSATTGFTNTSNGVDAWTAFETNGTDRNVLALSNFQYIHHLDALFLGKAKGQIHFIPSSTSNKIFYAQFPDIFTTDKENILYTNSMSLGIGYQGKCSSNSDATKIVDPEGRNFDTLGLGTTTGKNKVYNLTTGTEYTITSISTTNSTNDTLNFTAVSGKTNSNDDYFIAFSDNGSKTLFDFFASTPYPHYKGQTSQFQLVRQIVQFDTEYLITNGNWLAALSEDEATWNDNYKRLPASTDATCISVNQDRVLIGGRIRKKGRLLLWNGFSDGFLSQIELPIAPTAVKPYKTGWIVTVGSSIYYTDGYTLQKITTFPDQEFYDRFFGTITHNQIEVIDDSLFFNFTTGYPTTRAKGGLWVYEVGSGWTYSPARNSIGVNEYPGQCKAIKSFDFNGNPQLLVSNVLRTTGGSSNISRVTSDGTNPELKVVFDLKDDINVKQIGVIVGSRYNMTQQSAGSVTVSVNAGNYRTPLYTYLQVGSGSSASTIKVNGTILTRSGKVGQKIKMLSYNTAGQTSFIESIADVGTVNETWTISPVLSTTPETGSDLEKLNLYSCGSKTITNLEIPESGQLVFDVRNMLTDKIVVEIALTGNNSPYLDILGIDLYA
jgi:hypothetical protein